MFKSMENILVSVCMITYNHESFIEEAILSVLKQETDFKIELIIGEDNSSDKTREICNYYQNKFPEKVKLLKNERNLGMRKNFIKTLKSCNGKYIALCEGDDFWIDKNKLQSQVNILEEYNFSVCYHNVRKNRILDGNIKKEEEFIYNHKANKETVWEELFLGEEYIKTCSAVFVNEPEVLSPIYKNSLSADDVNLFLCLLSGGRKAFYINKVMAVYNLHANGVWSPLSPLQKHVSNVDLQEQAFYFFCKRKGKLVIKGNFKALVLGKFTRLYKEGLLISIKEKRFVLASSYLFKLLKLKTSFV